MVGFHKPVTLLSHRHPQPCWLQVEWRRRRGLPRQALLPPRFIHPRGLPVLCMHPTGHSSSSSPAAAIVSSPASKLRSVPFWPSAHLHCTVTELLFDGGVERFQWQGTSGYLLAQTSAPSRANFTVRPFAQGLVKSNFEYLQGWRFHRISSISYLCSFLPDVTSGARITFPSLHKKDKHTHSLKGESYSPGDSITLHLYCAFNHQRLLENLQIMVTLSLEMQPALGWDRE